jgi:hypothetical protein
MIMKMFKTMGLFFSVAGLISCGGGGGGGKKPEERPAGEVLGVAHDGPIQNGNISAFTYTSKGKGDLLASGLTNDVGDYSLSIKSADVPVYLEVTTGAYEEEASGRRVTLSGSQKLTAVTFYESGKPVNLQLTQYTTWAQCYSDYLIEKKGATIGNAIVEATETFGNLAGVPIIATRPIDITDEKSFSAFLTPGLRYGYLLAGISGLTKDLAELNNVQPHSSEQYTSIYFTGVVCADIKHDGLMNGIGAPSEGNPTGQLYIGKVALNQEHYRTMIGQNILEVAADPEINKAGIQPADLLSFANNISLNGHNIFAGVPPQAVDITGPTITPGLPDGSLVSGETVISVTAVDPLGVASVAFYLDDFFLQNGTLNDLKTTIITQNFADGNHVLKIVATDVLNNVSEYKLNLGFVNTGANLTITSPTLSGSTSYLAGGSYAKGAGEINKIVVHGVTATLNTEQKTWSAAITLQAGTNKITATVYDQFDNAVSVDSTVNVDLIYPTLFPENTRARFSTYQGQYNLCFYSDLNNTSAQNSAVCLDATKTQLNGKAVSSSLTNDNYLVLGVTVADPFGSGVFSDVKDLVVDYRYLRAGNVVIDWSPAPRQTQNSAQGWVINNHVYLPLVTEYLGNNFFITDNNEVHQVVFRVKDKAGNATELNYDFKLDVLTPFLAVTTPVIKNESLFQTQFDLRTGLNSATAEVAYTVTNETNIPYLVSFANPLDHSLNHTWESAVRKNRARVIDQEEWRVRWFKGYPVVVTTDWTPITEYYDTALKKVVSRPAPVMSAYSDIQADQMNAPLPTSWIDSQAHTCTPGSQENPSPAQYRNTSDSKLFACWYYWQSGQESGYYLTGGKYFEKRNTYTTENESGYPKNVITSASKSYSFAGNTIRLFNKTSNTEIFPVSGFFKIPPASTVEIVNNIKLPSVVNYIDSRVAVNDSSVPYASAISLDKSLSYTLNTAINMNQSIDPGDISRLHDVSVTLTKIGSDTPIIRTVGR